MSSPTSQRGFTLVEMLVSVSIFVIVAMMVSLVFVSLARSNRKAQDLKILIDNVNFTMDAMVLDLKFGHDYRCLPSPIDCKEIHFFDNSTPPQEQYYTWEQGGGVGRISKNGAALTAEGVNITYANFLIDDTGIEKNPLIRLFMVGEAAPQNGVSTKFNLQTVVSQRNL